ncbi:MAG: PaaI family thioesterase [Acidimicrobiia bacterium]
MERLTNTRWGFESNCFVCEDANEAGLRIPFHADHEAGEVVAEFTLDDRFSGAPTYVHGGVVLSVLDEAMAWATIALASSWAVTKETTTRFRAPVRVGGTYRVVARVTDDSGDELRCAADVLDGEGTVCATAQASFVPLGPAQAVEATGTDVSEADASFVRDRSER